MEPSKKAIDIIKEFEGFRTNSYLCPAGIPTIGYGSTGPDIKLGMIWLPEQGEQRLIKDVEKFSEQINRLLKVDVNQNMFDALVSFTYNVGINNLKRSTLLKKINSEDFWGAVNEFHRWNKAKGKELAGLTRRRLAEENLFKS